MTHILRNFIQMQYFLCIINIFFINSARSRTMYEILNLKVCKIGLSNCYIEIIESEIFIVISMGIFQEINISESVHIYLILHIDYIKKMILINVRVYKLKSIIKFNL